MEDHIVQLGIQLTDLMVRNTASFIADKVKVSKARRDKDATINELTEIINDLIRDKNDAIQIAQGYQQEVVAKRITDEEIEYIISTVVPLVEKLSEMSEDDQQAAESIETIKSLVSKETLTVLQTMGFDFREAIGIPLTILARTWILRFVPQQFALDTSARSDADFAQQDA